MSFTRVKPFLSVNLNDSRVVDAECIPQQAIPAVVKLMLKRTYKSSWQDGQHELGRDMVERIIVSLYAACLSPTAEAVNRVYRLLDHTISGRVYTVNPPSAGFPDGTPFPSIPVVPGDFDGGYGESLVARFKQLEAVVRNQSDGTAYGPYPQDIGQRQLLKDILIALQNQQQGGQLDDEMLAELIKIAGLLV